MFTILLVWVGLTLNPAGIGRDDGSFSFLRRHELWSAQEGAVSIHVTFQRRKKPRKSKKKKGEEVHTSLIHVNSDLFYTF